jgi:putative kinase
MMTLPYPYSSSARFYALRLLPGQEVFSQLHAFAQQQQLHAAWIAGCTAIQTLPMDGFHHYNSWLDAHQLRPFKGAPETFDVAKLAENLCQVVEGDCTWPQYDRQKHDPVEDALHVTAPLVIVEGNWLLLDDEKWCQLAQFCDFSIFINAPATALRERLVGRKLAGGVSLADAEAFYDRTDGPNVRRVLEESLPANLTLMMTATGEYRLVD